MPLGTNLMVKFGMSDNARVLLTLLSILVAAGAASAAGISPIFSDDAKRSPSTSWEPHVARW